MSEVEYLENLFKKISDGLREFEPPEPEQEEAEEELGKLDPLERAKKIAKICGVDQAIEDFLQEHKSWYHQREQNAWLPSPNKRRPKCIVDTISEKYDGKGIAIIKYFTVQINPHTRTVKVKGTSGLGSTRLTESQLRRKPKKIITAFNKAFQHSKKIQKYPGSK